MLHHDIFVLQGFPEADPAPVIAACRAGARGTLRWSRRGDLLAAIERLRQFASADFGVFADPSGAAELSTTLSDLPFSPSWVVLSGDAHQLASCVALLRERALAVFLEAVSLEEFLAGEALGVDGVLLKGLEAGGRVSAATSLDLLRAWRRHAFRTDVARPIVPVYVYGGVGVHSTAAVLAAGATGVVLDGQLAFARESSLRRNELLSDLSEERFVDLETSWGERFAGVELRAGELALELAGIESKPLPLAERRDAWREALAKLVGFGPRSALAPLGRDALLARGLAERFGTVAGIVDALVEQGARSIASAASGRIERCRERSESPAADASLEVGSAAELRSALQRRIQRFRLKGENGGLSLVVLDQACEACLEHLGATARGNDLSIELPVAGDPVLEAAAAAALAPLLDRGAEVLFAHPAGKSANGDAPTNGEAGLAAQHLLAEALARHPAEAKEPPGEPPSDVAIVGMAAFYPRAIGLRLYWENILAKVDAVTEVPPSHWDWRPYYDPDPRAKDKIISKWGGFLEDVPFDPFVFGITPNSVGSVEPLQLLLLEAVRLAIQDAGYARRPFARERTAAILGIGGGGSPMAVAYGLRACLPMIGRVEGLEDYYDEIVRRCDSLLPEWTEDSFPGILANVAAGRVANRFDFGGANYAIDAACASSLAAVHACVRELELGNSDVAIAMGADTVQTPYSFMAFSKTMALSPRGRCKPFDARADGIALSEGIGVAVLKRKRDAERDGDRIYAVIKGMGASSDGRAKGLTAPRAEGQLLALERAYAKAGVDPARVALIEAHGTGTVVGDQTESQTMGRFFGDAGAPRQSCAIGSVKSMIGHSKCAAGIAGLIKGALALHRKVLPPTLVDEPNPRGNFENGPLYLNRDARPWVHGGPGPRCAGVSSFGFGGTNFHAVLEEYTGAVVDEDPAPLRDWPAELVVLRRSDRASLTAAAKECRDAVRASDAPLGEIAAACWRASKLQSGPLLAIVATDRGDLAEKLASAISCLEAGDPAIADPRGVYIQADPPADPGKIAFLFPGQGSQYPNMLAETAIAFREVREALDAAEAVLEGKLERRFGLYLFPPSAFRPEQEQAHRAELTRTEIAQPAVGATSLGLARLLDHLGVRPDLLAGHSFGELTALCRAGAFDADDLIRLAHARGQAMAESSANSPGGMLALDADAAKTSQLLAGIEGATLANLNAPRQTVVAGSDAALERLEARAKEASLRTHRLPVATGFHSPLVAAAAEPLARALAGVDLRAPAAPVYANVTAGPYPQDPDEIRRRLVEQITAPVRFQEEVESLHAAGARIFIEVGPQGVLTGLVGSILEDRPHRAVALDHRGRSGLVQLGHALAQLLTAGVRVRLDRLFEGRELATLDPATLRDPSKKPPGPGTWVLNSFRARPLAGPEPKLMGQGRLETRTPAAAPATKTASPGAGPRSKAANTGRRSSGMTSAVSTPGTSKASSASGNGERPRTPASPAGHSPPALAPSAPSPSLPPLGSEPPGDDAAQVMLGYQHLMARFLETQTAVMLSYLQGGSSAPLPSLPAADAPRAVEAFAPTPSVPSTNGESGGDHEEASGADETLDSADAPVGSNGASDVDAVRPEAGGPIRRERLLDQLQDLVGKRTGYPKEMLGLDMDLEADLGIDSIKRVEILGTLAESVGAAPGDSDSSIAMEKLTSIRTLRGIVDYLMEALAERNGAGLEEAAPVVGESTNGASKNGSSGEHGHEASSGSNGRGATGRASGKNGDGVEVQRALVQLVPAPRGETNELAPFAGAIVLTDDGRGVAARVHERLQAADQPSIIVRLDAGGDGSIAVDPLDPASVTRALERVRETMGEIAGLIHLAPLAESDPTEPAERRIAREVRSFYLLARAMEKDVAAASTAGGGLLLTATALGGMLGFDDGESEEFFAPHGGLIGLSKCIALEWPDALVRAVDLDGGRSPDELAEAILAELAERDGPAEVGIKEGMRWTWNPVAAPLDRRESPSDLLAEGSTILVTGGARGITAKVAIELARRFRPNLILAGRSPAPSEEEPADVRDLTDPAAIKRALMDRMARAGRPAPPAAIEAAYQKLLREREIRGNLAELARTGATVLYRSVDVRDEEAFSRLLDEIDDRFGGLDGVLHGAGVIEDKLLRDKTPESFDRVFETKVTSALTLARRLDPERLKFLVLFSSVASRFGNRGQSDYAAANEVLSKLALQLDRRWPARVLSIAWGPWSGVGMVADLERHLVARGLRLIAPEEGPAWVVDELLFGAKGDSEVIIAGGAEQLTRPTGAAPAAPASAAAS